MFLDEISMVSADQLHQADVRIRQGKQPADHLFGKLAVVLSGDFLQLPPVDKDGSRKSLAGNDEELDVAENVTVSSDKDAKRKQEKKKAKQVRKRIILKVGMIWIMCMWCMENHIIGAHLFMGWEPFNVRERVSFDHMSSGAGTLQ